MPKVFVVILAGVLVIGVVTGAGFLVWRIFSSPDGEVVVENESKESEFGELQTAEVGAPSNIVETNDDDNDGLSNSDELIWGSDRLNPDTDGDGYLDGEEVAAGHDPTVPSPNDKLPINGAGAKTTNASLPLEAEQYLADNIDLAGDDDLEEKYEEQYSEAERSSSALEDFASKQEVISQLPRPTENLSSRVVTDTSSSLSEYLRVADDDKALANSVLYKQALFDLQQNNNPGGMKSLAALEQLYRQSLLDTPVPESALQLHTLLLGYTEILAATFDQIALWNEDQVKSAVATVQLEVIDRKYYPLIRDELQRLRIKQLVSGS